MIHPVGHQGIRHSQNFRHEKLPRGNSRQVDFLHARFHLGILQGEIQDFQQFDETRNKDRYWHDGQVVYRCYRGHYEDNRMRDDQALHS